MNFTELEQRINENKSIDFGDIFNKSIELFKKTWLQGLLVYILTMVLAFPIVLIVYVPLMLIAVSFGVMNESMEMNDEIGTGMTILLVVVVFFLYVIVMTLMFALQLIMRAAFYKICKDKDVNPSASSDEYFFYFKKKHLKKILLLSLISLGGIILGMMCFVVPGLILMVPLAYLPVVFAFNPELSAKEIFKTALNLGMKKWGITLLLMVVAWLLAMFVGLMACFVGVYVTMSFVYLPAYFVYKEVIGFKNDSYGFQEIEKIGKE